MAVSSPLLIPLAGVLGVVLQLTLAAAGLAGLAVIFSPVYGCACLYLSLRPVLLSPEMAVLSARVHAAGGALQSMNDPQLAIAVQALTQRGALDFLLPLLAMLCADVGQALYVATGAFVWDAMHALGAAVAAGALAWATWADGAHATSTASYVCWAVAVGAAAMLAKLADAAWGGALAAPKPGGAGWASLFGGSQVLLSAHAALAPAVCALLSRTGGALLAAAVPAARARAVVGVGVRPLDARRAPAQFAGAALLFVALALALLPSRDAAATFGLVASRAAAAAFTFASWCVANPSPVADPPLRKDGTPATLEELRAAHKARAAARDEPPPPPPLLVESWRLAGGIQSLLGIECALRRDADGDLAHEFYEAIKGGLFQLLRVEAK